MTNQNRMEIVGVVHERGNLSERTIDHIRNKHPNLESIMLEIPPDWEELLKREYSGRFFLHMAEYYQREGVRVIAGDRKYWEITCGGSPIQEQGIYESLRSLQRLWRVPLGFLTGRITNERNKNMEEVFMQEKPEVTCLGMWHARYIKQRHPDIPLTLFYPKRFMGKMLYRAYRKIADESYSVDQLNPRYVEEYKKGLVWVMAGIAGTGISIALPEDREVQRVIIGVASGILIGNNLTDCINYFRCLAQRNPAQE